MWSPAAVDTPASGHSSPPEGWGAALEPQDWATIDAVERSLRGARDLLTWFEEARSRDGFSQVFPLERTFNRPGSSFGFFGHAEIGRGSRVPVMGNTQRMFYDAPRVPATCAAEASAWTRERLREFVLRYFMRVSDFRAPEAYAETGLTAPPPLLRPLSWCSKTGSELRGFGFAQLYYKLRNGRVGRFPESQRYAILDLREIKARFEWVVLRVRIFDFSVRIRPFGREGPELSLPLDEQSLVVVAPDLVIDREDPTALLAGCYGFGYAFIRDPQRRGILAYGPGQFDAALQLLRWDVDRRGETFVDMLFLANRPTEIMSLALDPIQWGLRIAPRLLPLPQVPTPRAELLRRSPLQAARVDPVSLYIDLMDALTLGYTARRLCINRDQLDRDFLVQHFMQHYNAVVGSLLTWRLIPDWLDTHDIPAWVVSGVSA